MEVFTSSSNRELGETRDDLSDYEGTCCVTARGNVGHGRSVEVMHIIAPWRGTVEQLHDRPGLICTAECMRKQQHATALGETTWVSSKTKLSV
jgi:hypothetical protein